MSDRRRELSMSESGGLVTTSTAAQILGLTPNGFRAVVERGELRPAVMLEIWRTKGRLQAFWRADVEAYRAWRTAGEREAEAHRRQWTTEQTVLPSVTGVLPFGRY